MEALYLFLAGTTLAVLTGVGRGYLFSQAAVEHCLLPLGQPRMLPRALDDLDGDMGKVLASQWLDQLTVVKAARLEQTLESIGYSRRGAAAANASHALICVADDTNPQLVSDLVWALPATERDAIIKTLIKYVKGVMRPETANTLRSLGFSITGTGTPPLPPPPEPGSA